jgi:hypothetical protein
MEKINNISKIRKGVEFARPGVSEKIIKQKIAELQNLRNEISADEFQKRINTFRMAVSDNNVKGVEYRIYSKWTAENIQEVLDGLDGEKLEIDHTPNKVIEALKIANSKNGKKIDPPNWIETQIGLLKKTGDKLLEAVRKLKD